MPGTQIGDLPTPKPCKSGVFEKKNPKTWSLGPQTWKFPKYVSNQTRKADYFCQRLLYPIRCNLLRLLLNDLRYLVAASRRFSFFGSSDSKVSDSVWYSVSLSTSAIGRGVAISSQFLLGFPTNLSKPYFLREWSQNRTQFSLKLSLIQLVHYQDRGFEIMRFLSELPWQFQDFLIHREI